MESLVIALVSAVLGVLAGMIFGTIHRRVVSKAAELNAEHKVRGYIARDKDGEVWFYRQAPIRGYFKWNSKTGDSRYFPLDEMSDEFEIKWEDKPQQVELTIKRLI